MTGDTLPDDEFDPRIEQTAIEPLANEDNAPQPQPSPETGDKAPEATDTQKPAEAPQDPRAARLEALADKTRTRTAEEMTQEREAMTPVPAPATPEKPSEAAPAERMIRLKVRGEIVELPESEVIARAQKNDAADTYLTEARNLLEEAKRTARQPEPAKPAEPAPAEQAKIDRIAEAIEKLQVGADPEEVRALLDSEISERARSAARETLDEDRTRAQIESFDNEVDSGYESFRKEHETVASDPVAAQVVVAVAGGMEAEIIARYLEGPADQNTKSAFAQAGITAEGVRRYGPQHAHALFKDMSMKGYPLPRPSAIIQAAGKTVAERFAATTTAAPAPAPKPEVAVDRTQRKEALTQPERASIPRTPSGQFAPKTETERAKSGREELRAARRAGAARG